MNIKKIETNKRRELYFSESNITPSKLTEKTEFKTIMVYPEKTYQKFLGFGGAITQSSTISFLKLPDEARKNFVKDYFSSDGLNYSWVRLPIGSCDFSNKTYSYSSKKNLSDFSIAEDKDKILPLLNEVLEENKDVSVLSSPWSPPKFMKSNKMLILGGKLLPKYYELYAEYLCKYIQEYEKQGIKISYMTIQNETRATQLWESCIFTPEEEIDFIKNALYPAFEKAGISTKILIYDHNKERLYSRTKKEISELDGSRYISGIAYHYYTGDHFEQLKMCSEDFPDKLFIHTEGCTGYSSFKVQDDLTNAEIYAHDIIGDLNNGSNAYIDWNILLDNKGGPNHKLNFCDSPIMLNLLGTNYEKKLCYYYIGHFSKYIKPNAVRIAISKYTDSFEVTAFKNPDESIVVVLFNKNDRNKEYNLVISDNELIHDNLDRHAIVTYLITK